jgi:hypothetical protein
MSCVLAGVAADELQQQEHAGGGVAGGWLRQAQRGTGERQQLFVFSVCGLQVCKVSCMKCLLPAQSLLHDKELNSCGHHLLLQVFDIT